VSTVPGHIPTYVRAGAFIPLAKVVHSTQDYTGKALELHYYHDASVSTSTGQLYDDDGATAHAFESGRYTLVRFDSQASAGRLEIGLQTERGMHATLTPRLFALKVHNVGTRPRTVQAGGKSLPFGWDAQRRLLEVSLPPLADAAMKVVVTL